MKTSSEKRQALALRTRKQIWSALNIEKATKRFGYTEVKSAITNWLNLQRSRTSLEKKRDELEAALSEVTKKL